MLKRIGIIGDVHGRSDYLEALVNKIKKHYPEIKLAITGDLIDRGPDSQGVIDFCIANDIDSVIGNHDDWLVSFLKKGVNSDFVFSSAMKGGDTFLSFGITGSYGKTERWQALKEAISEKQANWLKNLPYYKIYNLEMGDSICLTHCGITKSLWYAAKQQMGNREASTSEVLNFIVNDVGLLDTFLWSFPRFPRNLSLSRDNDLISLPELQVFGHTIRANVIRDSFYVALDTGCGTLKEHEQKLSAIIFPENIIIDINFNDLKDFLNKE